MEIFIYIFMIMGLFFVLMSVLGLFRFPDVYTRLHASTKGTTFGAIFIIISIVVKSSVYYEGSSSLTIIIHSLIALFVIIITNPVGSHAIANAAYRSGVKPYNAVIDDIATDIINDSSKSKTNEEAIK